MKAEAKLKFCENQNSNVLKIQNNIFFTSLHRWQDPDPKSKNENTQFSLIYWALVIVGNYQRGTHLYNYWGIQFKKMKLGYSSQSNSRSRCSSPLGKKISYFLVLSVLPCITTGICEMFFLTNGAKENTYKKISYQ